MTTSPTCSPARCRPTAVLRLMVVKAVIWAIALGSGTSGGVLAPLLIMGGAFGALSGLVLPHAGVGDWALIGMAAMMGGTMRAPLTATMFAVELTGRFGDAGAADRGLRRELRGNRAAAAALDPHREGGAARLPDSCASITWIRSISPAWPT